ncbi:MAG: hypothetical protein J0L99_14320 [Chitinophagales bacterium]|nr:hypothetical protein [Chitinophagales bacterium]
MYHITESNERTSRRQAIVFTVLLHLILGVALYIQTMEKGQSEPPAAIVNSQNAPRP